MRDRTAPWYRLPTLAPPSDDAPPVIVVGAGLAGAAVARALAERGRRVIVLEAGDGPASGASGNTAGVVKPFVTRDDSPTNVFYRYCYDALQARLADPAFAERCDFQRCGVLQLIERAYPEREDYEVLDAAAASRVAGLPLSSPALWFADGGWLSPARLCAALLDHVLIECRGCTRLTELIKGRRSDVGTGADTGDPSSIGAWRLNVQSGTGATQVLDADQVVLATGDALLQTPYTDCLPIIPARGQISRFTIASQCAENPLRCVVSGRHYALPDGRHVYAGATFERGVTDREVRGIDHDTNRHAIHELLPTLPLAAGDVEGRAGIRATTPDRLPLLGPVPCIDGYVRAYTGLQHGQSAAHFPDPPLHRGLNVIGGLGSRGVVTAVGCGELLADYLCGDSQPMQQWMPLLHPARFCIRGLRRAV